VFLDSMEDNLKDVLNYYEIFCNELAEFDHEMDSSEKVKVNAEISLDQIGRFSSNSAAYIAQQLEIITEKDSMPTTSEYSPIDRVVTEPNKRKRESCSSLFRRSKIIRGCHSYTSALRSSYETDSADIIDNPNELEQSGESGKCSDSSASTSKREITCSEFTDSFDHNYDATEIEEGINCSFSSGSNYEEKTFESKPSSTYIDSNEEFIYSTKDLLPGPLNLDSVKKFTDPKGTVQRTEIKEKKEPNFQSTQKVLKIWTEREGSEGEKQGQWQNW